MQNSDRVLGSTPARRKVTLGPARKPQRGAAVTFCHGRQPVSPARRLPHSLLAALLSIFCAALRLPPETTATHRVYAVCNRPAQGADVIQPENLSSKNGSLEVSLSIHSTVDERGHTRYCYFDARGNQAPTLRVAPGDTLDVSLENAISVSPGNIAASGGARRGRKHDPCAGGAMSATSTNLHFHGLAVPPVCHQDETLRTRIEPGDPPFHYHVQIPKDQPPGLYWYHPHIHGFSEEHLLGGASGALIVEGLEKVVPLVENLPERVFVIRDEWMPEPSELEKGDPNRPTKQLSINYIPVAYPNYPPAVVRMKPLRRELWRVLNASADTYLALYVEFGGRKQSVDLVAQDGVPLQYGDGNGEAYVPHVSSIFLPPGTRAEFVVASPANAESGRLLTGFVFRGADDDVSPGPKTTAPPGVRAGLDDVDAARPLASILVSEHFAEPPVIRRAPAAVESPRTPLTAVRPGRKRTLYFSERLSDPADPKSATLFFITEDGRTPTLFDPDSTQPDITVRQGDVEDWNIENRSRESHTFHIHQLHFLVVGRRRTGWEEPTLRDTVNVPGWSGFGPFPRVTLRMDFRNPNIVGTLPFHCHIAQHLDGGMMGTVRIVPR